MKKSIQVSQKFEEDIQLFKRKHKESPALKSVLKLLAQGDELPDSYAPLPLNDELPGAYRCKIGEGNALIYTVMEDAVRLERIGSYAKLFDASEYVSKPEITAKEFRQLVGEKRAKAAGKQVESYLTTVYSEREPSEYVICSDGTQIPFSKPEESKLHALIRSELDSRRD